MVEMTREQYPFTIEDSGATWCCGFAGCSKRIPVGKKSGIAYHKNTHFPKYACEECSEVFAQKCQLDVHMRIAHTGERPYCCSHCQKSFPQMSNLQDHVRKNHAEDDSVATEKPKFKTFKELRLEALLRRQQCNAGLEHREDPGSQRTGILSC